MHEEQSQQHAGTNTEVINKGIHVLIAEKDQQLRIADIRVQKLTKINSRLKSQLKEMSLTVDKTLELKRSKAKISVPHSLSESAAKKEIENFNKQKLQYEKEIHSLQIRLSGKAGIEKISDFEGKLKQSQIDRMNLIREIKQLHQEQKSKGKELERVINDEEYQEHIKTLNFSLKQYKDRIQDLEMKIQQNEINRKRFEEYFATLVQK